MSAHGVSQEPKQSKVPVSGRTRRQVEKRGTEKT